MRKKLLGMVLLFSVLLVIMGAIAIIGYGKINEFSPLVYGETKKAVIALKKARLILEYYRRSPRDDYLKEITEKIDFFYKQREELGYNKMVLDPLNRGFLSVFPEYQEAIDLFPVSRKREAETREAIAKLKEVYERQVSTAEEKDAAMADVTEKMKLLIDTAMDFSRIGGLVLEKAVQLVNRIVLFSLLTIFLIGTVLGVWISRSITRPLSLLSAATLAIRKGDFTQRVNVESKDELGDLATSFNIMVKALEESRDRLEEARNGLERKVKERTSELEQSKAQIENILQSQIDLVFVIDSEGNIMRVNRAALTTLGYREEELVGRHISEVFATQGLEKIIEKGPKRALKGERVIGHEVVVVSKDGKKIPTLFNAGPIKDANGNIIGAVSYTHLTLPTN